MSDPKLLPDISREVDRAYANASPEWRADTAVKIFASSLAARDSFGRVVFHDDVEIIAPRLVKLPEINERTSDRAKCEIAARMARRAHDEPTPTTPRKAVSTAAPGELIANPTTDAQKLSNYTVLKNRARAKLQAATEARQQAAEEQETARQQSIDDAVARAAAELNADDGETRTHAQSVVHKQANAGKINIAEIRARLGNLPGSDVRGGQS